jgi:uncharacterized protein
MRSIISIFFFYFILIGNNTAQEKIKILSKYFVKKGKIVFRIVPVDMKSFAAINLGSMQVVRSENKNGGSQNETIVEKSLKRYDPKDFRNWIKLLKKDKNKGSFVYQALYNNKPDSKLSAEKREKYRKMLYDMLLLSCDLDADISRACGLYFQDTIIRSDVKYTYTIHYKSPEGKTQAIEVVPVDPSVLSINNQIKDVSAEIKRRIITLKWNAKRLNNDYGGYNIERSDDSITFHRINKSPVILFSSQFEKSKEYLFYSDTMPEPNHKYFYRISGVNFFGEKSDPSNTVFAFSAPEINSIPVLDSITCIKNTKVFLKWTMTDRSEIKYIKKFILLKSKEDKGPYHMIYNGSDLVYTDSILERTNFYKVGAIISDLDTLLSYSQYAVVIDDDPPAAPAEVHYVTDKKGFVTINWRVGREEDIKGYKLFKANSLNEEFIQVNNKFIEDTFYTEKLNLGTLSRNIFYCVSAVDQNFNCSARSKIIKIVRPDTIVPSSPLFKSVVPDLRGIRLDFIMSHSDDVKRHTFNRKEYQDSVFKAIIVISDDSTTFFMDTTVLCGNTYVYQILVEDSSGNISTSKSLIIKYETGFRKMITDVKYKVDRTSKSIYLSWNYPEQEIEKFVLYRGKENQPVSILKTIDGTAFNYKDNNLNIGSNYEYRIKAIMRSGAESIISDPIKIRY